MTKEKSTKRSRWLWIIAAVAVIGVGFLAFTLVEPTRLLRADADGVGAQDSQVAVAALGDLTAEATASGYVQASRETRLSLGVSGVVDKVAVAVGDEVQAGDVLVQLDTAALERSLANAELSLAIQEANLQDLLDGTSAAELASAQASVASAQANLEKVQAGATAADVQAARASLAAAQASYDKLLAGPDSATVTQAQASLDNAEAALRRAQSAYDRVADRPDVGMTQQALELEQATNNYQSARASYDQAMRAASNDQIQQSRANVDQAKASLQRLLDSPTPAELATAESQLAQAQAQRETALQGASAARLDVAQAQVEQARLNVQEAQATLAKGSLTAPFDGTITAVHISEGELASGLAVEIADTTRLQVALNVDEVDVGELALGQPAVVTLETWPDHEIQGKIASIAPRSNESSSALVSYEVLVNLGQTELPVRIGMSAEADLITAARTGVLLAPTAAITPDRAAGKYYVNRVRTGADGVRTTERVEVTIGLKDGNWTEITSGLRAGDEVVIGELTVPQVSGSTGFFGSGMRNGEGSGSPFGQ
ncbi:MAG: efflux RND transporter periplasmic adaptor subunit [Anaerolinea sp.]|nr:efflux RND transporter periplasmic adaptor subunit [Anaerolinea sp.]